MKYIILACLVTVFCKLTAQTNPDEELAVKKTIEALFDGMRLGDSTKVHAVFSDQVQMFSVYENRKGEEKMKAGDLKDFLNAVGTAHEEIWDERIGAIKVRLDGRLAQVWTAYHFYLGEKFSHCGVNSFQLVKEEGHWKIVYLVDTRRTKDCVSID